MHYKITTLVGFVASAIAATIDVDVGEGAIRFDPETITAAVGDVIQFHFYANATYGVHAVAVADYNTPCVPAAGSFFSDFLEGDAEGKTTFSYNVQDTNTKWVYCPAKKHCQNGMVAVINAPAAGSTGNQTLEGFKAAAAAVPSASFPASVTGGTVSTATGAPSESTTAPPTSTDGASGATPTSGAPPASSSSPGVAPRMAMDVGALAAMAGGVAAFLI